MTSDTIDILGLGSSCVDDLLIVESYPGRNEKIFVLDAKRLGGGLTGSALVAASRLGCACGLVIRLDHGEIASFIRESLSHEGITLFEQTPGPSFAPFHSIIIVEKGSGERTIFSKPATDVAPDIGDNEYALLDRTKCLFVDFIFAAKIIEIVEHARTRGIPVVGDFENRADRSEDLMALIDHLIVPLHFAKSATGSASVDEAVTRLVRQPGRSLVCATDSERGCWFATADAPTEVIHVPAFKVNPVVDTTGCGDVFHGAYAASLVKGFPPHERIRRAAAVAAIKAGRLGAQQGTPTLDELTAFLQNA